jgi:hypothetical protein
VSELFAVSEQLVQPIDDFFSNVFVMAVRPPAPAAVPRAQRDASQQQRLSACGAWKSALLAVNLEMRVTGGIAEARH